jgi:hypothetical protein
MFVCKSWFHIVVAVVLKEHFMCQQLHNFSKFDYQDCIGNKATKGTNVIKWTGKL